MSNSNTEEFVIPVLSEGNTTLTCTNANINYAILFVNNTFVQIIEPNNSEVTNLDFLGGLPLRMNLLNSNVLVKLITTQGQTPSLKIMEHESTITDIPYTEYTTIDGKKHEIIYDGTNLIVNPPTTIPHDLC